MKAMDDYAVQDDLRTVVRAHQIKSDPKRIAAVKAHHAAMTKAMAEGTPAEEKGESKAVEAREVKQGKGDRK